MLKSVMYLEIIREDRKFIKYFKWAGEIPFFIPGVSLLYLALRARQPCPAAGGRDDPFHHTHLIQHGTMNKSFNAA